MGACETTPATTSTGEPASDLPFHPTPAAGSSSLPMIGRRLPASSSFVLAAARLRALQLDPGRAAAQTGSDEEKPHSSHTPAAEPGHRVRSPRPLDSKDPMGAGFWWQVQDSNLGRLSSAILQTVAGTALTWANVRVVRHLARI